MDEGVFIQWRVGVLQYVGVTYATIEGQTRVQYIDAEGDADSMPLEDIEQFKKLKL